MELFSLILHNQGRKTPKAGKKNNILGDFFFRGDEKRRENGEGIWYRRKEKIINLKISKILLILARKFIEINDVENPVFFQFSGTYDVGSFPTLANSLVQLSSSPADVIFTLFFAVEPKELEVHTLIWSRHRRRKSAVAGDNLFLQNKEKV